MLKIKLARIGKRNQPHYRIVVQERRSKANGGYLANLGHYDPLTNPSTIKLDTNAYQNWLTKGAQPTTTVKRLYEIASKPQGSKVQDDKAQK